MRPDAPPRLRPTLTAPVVRLLAILAMVVQVVFFAEHLGAAAVQGMGHLPPGERMGFLQLCTGEGIALFDPASGKVVGVAAPSSGSHSDCAVCASASVCSFAQPTLADLVVPPPRCLTTAPVASVAVLAILDPIARPGQIRAPPVA